MVRYVKPHLTRQKRPNSALHATYDRVVHHETPITDENRCKAPDFDFIFFAKGVEAYSKSRIETIDNIDVIVHDDNEVY